MSGYLEDSERRSDGRNVDPELGTLEGEGAHQKVHDLEGPYPAQPLVRAPEATLATTEPAPTYYGQPIVKQTVWVWTIPLYFYVGGLAGAASVLGMIADLAGRGRLGPLVWRAHWVGAIGDALGGALLIKDLGRPERFLNMLRVFRVRSPMSMGSWILAGSGAANGAAVLLGHRKGALGHVASVAAGALGPPLSGYTALLLNNTANPLWQRTHRSLPPFFMSSAMASSGALLDLLPHGRGERRIARDYGRAGAALALLFSRAVERDVARSETIAPKLKHGVPGALWRAFKLASSSGLALSLAPRRRRARWMDVAADLLINAGSVAARFAIFYAGKASARDPQATFGPQRQGLGAAEVGPASQVLSAAPPAAPRR